MLDRLREELMKKQELHEELVKKYDEMVSAREKISADMTQLEKEIIHNQGAMETINALGMELLEKEENQTETVSAEQVEIVE